MSSPTYLLDTSAILAHYFDEPGAQEVDRLWQEPANRLTICVLSIPELKTRLAVEMDDALEAERAFDLYVNELTTNVPVDRETAAEAVHLREAASGRLPLVDACIAACARVRSCELVHRDPHMDRIPAELVPQLRLPDRLSP